MTTARRAAAACTGSSWSPTATTGTAPAGWATCWNAARNSRIGDTRAHFDPRGPGGKPLALFESGAILVYLAEKSGQLIPQDAAGRYQAIQWVMFQMGGIGPMFGQLGFFHKFAGKDWEDKRPRDRYAGESKRLLAVLDGQLQGRPWVLGDAYSIADIAIFPWVRNLVGFYGAGDLVGFDEFSNVQRVLDAFVQRPAVIRGLDIPPKPAG